MRRNPRGFGFCDGGSESVFCPPDTLSGTLDADEVEVTVVGDRATSLQVLRRTRREVVGTVKHTDAGLVLVVDPYIGELTVPLSGRARAGQTVVARLRGDKAAVTERHDDPFDALRTRVLVRAQLPRTMPDPVDPITLPRLRPHARRRDLRDTVTLTIDDAHSADLDDALSVDGPDRDGCMRLSVHIADVAEHVLAGSTVDVAAAAVGTSVYLHPWVRPMLPAALSEASLSLLPGADRDTLTVELRISPEGAIASVDVYESRIRSNGRLDYHLASAVLREEHVDVDVELRETLRRLRAVSARLEVARRRRGGLAPRVFEPELRGDSEARDLIERCMVAANEAVADWMAERGVPGLWRAHDAPGVEEVRELDELVTRLGYVAGLPDTLTPLSMAALDAQLADAGPQVQGLWHAALDKMGRARYQTTPAPHFGLGSESYCHFTSPLRRYADLVVHRQVKAYLSGQRDQSNDWTERARLINTQTSAASQAESQLHAASRLAGITRGTRVGGVVTAIRDRSVRVWLDAGVRATVPIRAFPGRWVRDGVCLTGPGASICPGRRLRFSVLDVDPVAGIVELRPERL